MSSKNDHPSIDGGGNKRKHSRNNKQQADNSTSYMSISFNKRISSGRPGSPHRYFDSSYDVFMEDTTSDNVLEATSQQPHSIGNQVVHRHLNGLCIITAGNVIQQQQGCASNDDNNKEDGILQIKSIKYHIQASKDSQSARGKIRTKKKRKKQQSIHQNNDTITAEDGEADGEGGSSKIKVANHDGYVLPYDTICTVTFSNGKEIELKCCVEGTVIEINNRLVDGSKSGSDDNVAINSSTTQRDVSLLMKEPLLDGFLAVIMPSRGVFPPR